MYLQVFQPGTALIFRAAQIVADELFFSSEYVHISNLPGQLALLIVLENG